MKELPTEHGFFAGKSGQGFLGQRFTLIVRPKTASCVFSWSAERQWLADSMQQTHLSHGALSRFAQNLRGDTVSN